MSDQESPSRPAPSAPHDDEVDNVRAVIVTTTICTVAVVAAHVLIGVNYWYGNNGDPTDNLGLTWQPIVGAALSTVAIVAFGGFYVAARRARVGIGAAFILTFLAMLSFALTIPALGRYADTDFVRTLVQQFSGVVGTVVAFYFGSEAVISGLKLWKIAESPASAEAIKRADRDLGTSRRP